jgi:sugar transferase (PEP-CTERM system associated)
MTVFGQRVHLPIPLLAITEFALGGGSLLLSAAVTDPGNLSLVAAPLGRWALGFGLVLVLSLTALGLYELRQRFRPEDVLVRVAIGVGLAALCAAMLALSDQVQVESRLWLTSFVLGFVALSAARGGFALLIDHDMFRRSVLVYGAGTHAANLFRLRRRSDRRGFKIVGFVAPSGEGCLVQEQRILRIDGTLFDYARAHAVREVVVAMDDRRQGFPTEELLQCRLGGINVTDLLCFLERETGKLKVDLVTPAWLIFSGGFAVSRARAVVSRIFDVCAALGLSLLMLPVMALIAVAILLEDGAPVLYRQRRAGLGGDEFVLYKFRSMIRNAEADGRAQWAGEHDRRVTRVGAVIRKLRLDELPQLYNVLVGDMSIVGPRPERPEFVATLSRRIPYYAERHRVKPGITGWAQVRYPYGSSEQDALEKLQYDLYYVKHKSFIFDLTVILQTIEVMLWGKGAR